MSYTPTIFRKTGYPDQIAYTAGEAISFRWDGWLPVGEAPPGEPGIVQRVEDLETTAAVTTDLVEALQTSLEDVATTANAATSEIETINTVTIPDAAATKGLPSYITARKSNPYDPRLNVYNLKPSNTRKLRAGLARSMRGGRGEIFVIGDSGATGATSTVAWDRPRSWPYEMGNELARHGIPKGGTGLVRLTDAGLSADTRWGTTGSWNATGKWYAFTAGNGATATFTSDFTGDRVALTYYDVADGATFTVSINGVSQGTVTCSGPAGLKTVVYTAAIASGQTVVLTKTSAGGLMDIVGVNVWSNANAGLVVHNIAQSGATASGSGAAAWVDSATTAALGTLIVTPSKLTTTGAATPDCVMIGLGGNDMQMSASDATITAAITTIRNRFSSSDVILVAETVLNTTLVSASRWEQYLRAMYDLADTLDCPLVDQRARLGDYATVVANGLSTDGVGHLVAGANAGLGRNLGQILAA